MTVLCTIYFHHLKFNRIFPSFKWFLLGNILGGVHLDQGPQPLGEYWSVWPVGQDTQQEVSGGPVNEASPLYLQPLPTACITARALLLLLDQGWHNTSRDQSFWNHPPPHPWEKLYSTKPVPDAQIVGDCWSRGPGCFYLQPELVKSMRPYQFRFLTWILSIHTCRGCDSYQKNHQRHSSSSSFYLSTNTSLEITSCLPDSSLFISI